MMKKILFISIVLVFGYSLITHSDVNANIRMYDNVLLQESSLFSSDKDRCGFHSLKNAALYLSMLDGNQDAEGFMLNGDFFNNTFVPRVVKEVEKRGATCSVKGPLDDGTVYYFLKEPTASKVGEAVIDPYVSLDFITPLANFSDYALLSAESVNELMEVKRKLATESSYKHAFLLGVDVQDYGIVKTAQHWVTVVVQKENENISYIVIDSLKRDRVNDAEVKRLKVVLQQQSEKQFKDAVLTREQSQIKNEITEFNSSPQPYHVGLISRLELLKKKAQDINNLSFIDSFLCSSIKTIFDAIAKKHASFFTPDHQNRLCLLTKGLSCEKTMEVECVLLQNQIEQLNSSLALIRTVV